MLVEDQQIADQDILSYAETAQLLRVSGRTLERWVRERRIPYVQYPRRGAKSGIRFVRSQVVKWLEQQTVRPARPRFGMKAEHDAEE